MWTIIRFWAAVGGLALACTASAQAQPHDRLTIGLGAFPAGTHPVIGSQRSRNYIIAAARRSVTRYDAEGHAVCQLCTELPTMQNGAVTLVERPDGTKGMEVVFTLRPGLKWGDGTALTTKDILLGAELERMFNPRTNLTGVTALDDRRFKMVFKAPRFDVERLAPEPINAAIEEPLLRAAKDPLDYAAHSAFNRDPTVAGLWNGPYLLTGFQPGATATFTSNPYWDGERPGFRQVTMRRVEGGATLEAALLAGDIDIANDLSFDQAIDLQAHHADQVDVALTPALRLVLLFLNNDNPLLADKRVRQAMMLAINRKGMVEHLFGARWPVATSTLPVNDPNFNAALKPWPYDPARARALLADAGFTPGPDGVLQRADGTRLSLEIVGAGGLGVSAVRGALIRSDLGQVGIETVPKAVPDSAWEAMMAKRRFSGIVVSTDSHTPDIIPWNQFATGAIPRESNHYVGENFIGYSNPRLDTELSATYAELDRSKRKEMLDDVQATIMDDLPEIPLYTGANLFVSPKWLTGLTPPRSTYVATLWIEYWKPRN